jgi:hypothetical protein
VHAFTTSLYSCGRVQARTKLEEVDLTFFLILANCLGRVCDTVCRSSTKDDLMLATQKRPAWQYLNQVAGGRVLISPKEGEPFGLSIDDVVAACRSQENIASFTEQVCDLLDRVAKWLGERASEIHKAYFGLEPDGAVVAVVRQDKRFNPDFETALSELDLSIADDPTFNLIKLRVFALPFCSDETVASFVRYTHSWPAPKAPE